MATIQYFKICQTNRYNIFDKLLKFQYSTTWIIFVIFNYIFPIKFKLIPIDTGRIIIIFTAVYVLLKYKYSISILWFRYSILSITIIVIAIFAMTINNVFELKFLLSGMSILMYSFPCIYIADMVCKNNTKYNKFDYLLNCVLSAIFLQSIISLACFFNFNLKNYLFNIIIVEGIPYDLETFSFRLIALSKIQFGNMAVIYGIGLWIWIYVVLCSSKRFNRVSKILYTIIIISIVVSGILSARTFFILLFLGGILCIRYYYSKKGLNVIKYVILGSIIIGIVFTFTLNWLKESEYSATYNWAFEWYENLADGKTETKSTNVMKSMYIFPTNVKTWLIGDGRMTDGNGFFYMNTDIGYLRNLYRWGIFGSIVYFYILYSFYKMNTGLTNNPSLKTLFLFIIIWTFLYQFKELWTPAYLWPLFLGTLYKITQKHSRYDLRMHCNT